ncbi:hypothetical protein EKE94_00975 [Mesobaculum littorinae]|uniref:Biopolymer transporter Tol n=1 Tax=Mesobaculum littorinae TaxID=2486419 RepID=A0A438AKU6_9RHOB|nr:hypothetical protein [Mesobaculum littorinae]RVV99302.1 hypothetical protein EKE94_00975 [Mesobaculum littorinae]
MSRKDYPRTPDGRYFVARGRLWRCTDPGLSEEDRAAAVKALMQARRAVREAGTDGETRDARDAVDAAKRRLGERGPVWWSDDAPDETRRAPLTSSYAAWWSELSEDAQKRGLD